MLQTLHRWTSKHLSDRFAEHLRSIRSNDVDKPVARHFNAANHSISDINVCAISPFSGSNDSRKRQEKRLIHPHGVNERFSFIWSLHSFCFCPAWADKSDVHPLFTSRVRLVYWSTLKIANDLLLCIIMHCYCFSHLIGLLSVCHMIISLI